MSLQKRVNLRGLRSGWRGRVLKLLSRHPKGESAGMEDWFPIATQVRGCDLQSRVSQRGRRQTMMAVSGSHNPCIEAASVELIRAWYRDFIVENEREGLSQQEELQWGRELGGKVTCGTGGK